MHAIVTLNTPMRGTNRVGTMRPRTLEPFRIAIFIENVMTCNVETIGQCPTNHIEGQLWSNTVLDGIELDDENREIEDSINKSNPDLQIQCTTERNSTRTHPNVMSTNGISVTKVCIMRNMLESLLTGVILCLIRERLKRKRNPHRQALARTPF